MLHSTPRSRVQDSRSANEHEPPSQAPSGLEGGLGVPSGDFSDRGKFDAKTGFQFGGSVDHMITDWIAVGADGSYNRNKRCPETGSVDTGLDGSTHLTLEEFTTLQFGVHAKIFIPMAKSPVSLWALLGVSGYSLKEKVTATYSNGAPSTNDLGNGKTGMRPGGRSAWAPALRRRRA